jgi:MFS family permease
MGRTQTDDTTAASLARTLLETLRTHYSSLDHLRDRTVATLAVANLLDGSSTSILVPLLPLYAASLDAGPVLLGLLFTLPTAGRAALSTPMGRLADRVGRRPLIVAGMAVGAASVLGLAAATGPVALVACRAVDGVGAAMRGPASTAYLGDLTTEDERGSVVGAYQTLGMLSVAVGPALGGALVAVSTLSLPFLVLGSVSLVGAAALWAVLPPSDRGSDEADESETPPEPGASDESDGWLPTLPSSPSFSPVERPGATTLVVSAFLANLGTGGLEPTMAPLLGETVGAGPTEVSLAWSAFGASMALFVPVGGTLADRTGRRRAVVAGKTLWAVVAVGLVAARVPGLPPLVLAVGGVASALAGPALGALYYEVAPEGDEAAVAGLVGTAGATGSTVGPLLAGVVSGHFGVEATVLGVGVVWALDAVLLRLGLDPE